MKLLAAWWLRVGVGACGAVATASCAPIASTCTETATCEPAAPSDAGSAGVAKDGGGSDRAVDEATSEADSADVTTEAVKPPEDAPWDASVADSRADMSQPEDARSEVDVGLDAWDAASEADAACDPGTSKSPAESACLISEKYGVFVSPQGSDAAGAGTRAAPYKTLAQGLQSAKGQGKSVYACDDGAGYPEALGVDAGLDGASLYGGFECAGWTYATTRRARVHAGAGARAALTVQGLTVGLTVENFEFVAADGAAGESSIGAKVEGSANVVLRGVRVSSGKGGSGAPGADGAQGMGGEPASAQQDGLPAGCFIDAGAQFGGTWNGPSTCGSQGGTGGTAAKGLGAAGVPGTPQTDVDPAGVDNRGHEGAVGGDGKAGSKGVVGTAGAVGAQGTFTSAGYTVGPGGAGGEGTVGQGGGGGGASNATSPCMGASGGAGGIGGCGGKGATGGVSAGASVGMLVWASTVTLDRCEVLAGDGGGGGNGGNGGGGGPGAAGGHGGGGVLGDAAMGVGKGGSGGVGGQGGPGGAGAGGHGGPSYAVVYKTSAPTRKNGTVVGHGAGGAKGLGGVGGLVKAPDGTVGGASDEVMVP